MTNYRKKLIEVAMPLEAINAAAVREGYIYKGNPSSIHKWWAQRALAVCRAVLFGQLVDDPSSWPSRFPHEEQQDAERNRLFSIIEELVVWENSNNTRVINAARKEIAQSLARNLVADGDTPERSIQVLEANVKTETIDSYLAEVAPPVHDPFAGGGSIPLEAQRLGLRTIATDLNPIAVLINKALIEVPPKFAAHRPVHPKTEKRTSWIGAEGLAADVRRYGEWMRKVAFERIGHLYPEVDLPDDHGGGKATVIAWLWARTVESPNPAFKGVHVPLARSFLVSTRKGKRAWAEPVFSEDRKSYHFEIRTGEGKPTTEGTVTRRGGVCLASGDPIPFTYIRSEAKAGRMGAKLMAVVAEGNKQRIYISPTEEMQTLANSAHPKNTPDTDLPEKALGFRVQEYGMAKHRDLFTPRQLVALTTFSDLIGEVRAKALSDACDAGWEDDGRGLDANGSGATAYAESIALYLAFAVDKTAEYSNSLAIWYPKEDRPKGLFARHAIPMVWDYVEQNPLGSIGGTLERSINIVCDAIPRFTFSAPAQVHQAAAQGLLNLAAMRVVSTDPPYYDNIGYADLSDFFYVWIRRSLQHIFPSTLKTLLTPKAEELVANPHRHGGASAAESFFLEGMESAISTIETAPTSHIPLIIYYAFKQNDSAVDGSASSGWEAFLTSLIRCKLTITGTWPVRTERSSRAIGLGNNALASCVILICRARQTDATQITRSDYQRLLIEELPSALRALEKGGVAPVDMAQASIGPGMAIFSRYSGIVEANGFMSVGTALKMINQAIDELDGSADAELDAATRFATSWYELHGFDNGPSGDAINLANARGISLEEVVRSGLALTTAGTTRLLRVDELPAGWHPASDTTLTVWECTHHLVKRLESAGETEAATLLAQIGVKADAAGTLTRRLFTRAGRKGHVEEAQSYNGLAIAWPELEKLVAQSPESSTSSTQGNLFESN